MNTETVEKWKDVVEFKGLYMVSNQGKIKNCRGRILAAPLISGYPTVCLRKDGKSNLKRIHRLVAQSFIPNPDNKSRVRFKDGIKTNISASNLEWVEASLFVECRKIVQKDFNGNVINIWNSFNEAVYGAGVVPEFLKRALRKKISGGGFLWEFKESEKEKKEEEGQTGGFFIDN